jgi:hypothetical protein
MNKMNTVRRYILLISIALLTLGFFFKKAQSVLIPFGFSLLLIGYLWEQFATRNKRYKRKELSSRMERDGSLSVRTSQLLIGDKWSLQGCLKLDGFDGCYHVDIHELFKDDFALISSIKFVNKAELIGEAKTGLLSIAVDSGWILFLASSAIDDFKPNRLEKIIQQELRSLPKNKPLRLRLRDDGGKEVGIVVSTGEGDGVYHVEYMIKGGRLVTIEANFIDEANQ